MMLPCQHGAKQERDKMVAKTDALAFATQDTASNFIVDSKSTTKHSLTYNIHRNRVAE